MKIHINRYVPYTSTTREPKPITFALHDNPASGVTDTHMSVGRRLQINMNIAKDKIDKSSYILDSIWDSNTGVVLPITAPNIKALDTIGELYTVLSQTLFTEELKLASWRKSSEKLSDYLGTVVTSLNISRSAIEETKQKHITRLQELEKKIPFAQFHDKAMAIQQAIHMNEQLAWRVMPSVMPVQPPIRELVAQSSVIDMSSNAINVENIIDVSANAVDIGDIIDISSNALQLGKIIDIPSLLDISSNPVDVSSNAINVENIIDVSANAVDIGDIIDISSNALQLGKIIDIPSLLDISSNPVDVSSNAINVENIIDVSSNAVDIGDIIDISSNAVDIGDIIDISSNATHIGIPSSSKSKNTTLPTGMDNLDLKLDVEPVFLDLDMEVDEIENESDVESDDSESIDMESEPTEGAMNERLQVIQDHKNPTTKKTRRAPIEGCLESLIPYTTKLENSIKIYQDLEKEAIDTAVQTNQSMHVDIDNTKILAKAATHILDNLSLDSNYEPVLKINDRNIEALRLIKELRTTLKNGLSEGDFVEASSMGNTPALVKYLLTKNPDIHVKMRRIETVNRKHQRTIGVLVKAQADHAIESHKNIEDIRRLINVDTRSLNKYKEWVNASQVDSNASSGKPT